MIEFAACSHVRGLTLKLATLDGRRVNWDYDLIHFADLEAKKRALRYLMGRYSFTSWKTGEMILPAAALQDLEAQGIAFDVRS